MMDPKENLTIDEAALLYDKVLPTAIRWVTDYPINSTLFNYGLQTVMEWNEQERPEIQRRLKERDIIEGARHAKTLNPEANRILERERL